MTAATYESTTVTDFGSDATNHSANMPATVNAGDGLVAAVAMDAATTTITTPSGWTLLIDNINIASRDPAIAIYGKIADGTEDGTTVNWITSNSQRGSIHVIRFSSWAGSLEGLICAIGTSNASISPMGISFGDITRDALWIAIQFKSSTTAYGTVPSGYSNENKTNVSEDSTSSASVASATKTSTAANEVLGAMWNSINALNWYSCLIVVLPTGIKIQARLTSTPATATLVLTSFPAGAFLPKLVVPGTRTLTITTFAPSVTIISTDPNEVWIEGWDTQNASA